MSDYLPLCAFRQGLLPATCQRCAWWQTSGVQPLAPEAAADRRRRWMTALEDTWGNTGLLVENDRAPTTFLSTGSQDAVDIPSDGTLLDNLPASGSPAPSVVASISFAPIGAVPRLHDFCFCPLAETSALVFCLVVADGQPRSQAKRVLNKALAQLKARGVEEVYAIARSTGKSEDQAACRYFAADFLTANGFEQVMENCGVVLMRIDLRGLLSLVERIEAAVRRILRNDPTPSPAAWSHRSD